MSERISVRISRLAKPRERDIRKLLVDRVTSHGGCVRAISYLGRNGAPDVLCLFPQPPRDGAQNLCWVETKMGSDGVLSEAQKNEIALLIGAGQWVEVITNLTELNAWLPAK